MGSPPPEGSKNVVLKLRSVNNIVIAPAKTGNDNKRSIAVKNTAQTNNGILCMINFLERMLIIVVMKLTAPKIDDAPDKCKLKIARSTAAPEWATISLSGGYTVQPVPAPNSTREDNNSKIIEGGSNQKLTLFKRGKAISGAPIISGTNQLPKPPINTGITKKNIIRKACAVTITLYN